MSLERHLIQGEMPLCAICLSQHVFFFFMICFILGYKHLLYAFSALLKSTGLRSDGRIDDRTFWINYVSPLPTPLVIPLVYPRMIAIHDLNEKVCRFLDIDKLPSLLIKCVSSCLIFNAESSGVRRFHYSHCHSTFQ